MRVESVPSVYRTIIHGATRKFEAKKVAQKPNPGPIFSFRDGKLFRFSDSMMDICSHDENPGCLEPCSPEEVWKLRAQILNENVVSKEGK